MARHGKFKKGRPKRPSAVAKPSPPRFTMQQEARNTEIHTRSWASSNLRHKAVQFVSAGKLQGSNDEAKQDDDSQAKASEQPPNLKTQESLDASEDPPDETGESFFFLDSTGGDAVQTGLPNPITHVDSTDEESDDSEDEVVFLGRQNGRKPIVIETGEAEIQKYLQAQTLSSSRTEQLDLPDHDLSTPPNHMPLSLQERKSVASAEATDTPTSCTPELDDLFNSDDIPQRHTPAESGTDVTQTGAYLETTNQASKRVNTPPADKLPEDWETEDNEVQGSIEVLSKIHLDTQNDSHSSEDDDMDLESSEQSDDDMDDMDDEGFLEELAINYHTERKEGQSGKHDFPSATAFADALESDPYYGFDITDFDRPSLQRRSKGKRAPLLEDLMLSDSDLELQLQGVWQTDRSKKKAKKQEREELRAQGLLGRKEGDPDLSVKYAKGMNVEDLITEIRSFLLSPKNSLALPPTTKHRRKTIHELANKVDLKSQSRGNGTARFTVLVKTSRTPSYTRKTISQVDTLLSGRRLNRRLYQSWGSDAPKPTKPKRGGTTAGVSYMDGDVVGGSAPEIGIGNRGRAMLEKMGWSSGTALGATNNKGILQPVTHVVKNSRTGLG